MRRVPLLVALLPMAAGIVLAEALHTVPLAAWLWTMAGVAAATAVWLIGGTSKRGQGRVKVGITSVQGRSNTTPSTLVVVLLALFFAAFGGARIKLAHPTLKPNHYVHHLQTDDELELRLVSPPQRRPNSIAAVAEVVAVSRDGRRQPTCGRLQLHLAADPVAARLRYGSRMLTRATPRIPPDSVGPDGFNYRRHLHLKGIERQCYLAPGRYRQLPDGRPTLRSRAEALRQRYRQRLASMGLTQRQTGVAEALLLGWRADLDDETAALYRTAGVAHMLCVSGLHVGIVAAVLSALLWPLGRRRWQRAVRGAAVAGGVWLFALLSGLAPATVRAAVMLTIITVADVMGWRTSRYNTVALAAWLMLLWSPGLLFDVGFELSYAAVLGIVAGSGTARRLAPHGSGPLARLAARGGQLLVLSTSAQLATLPFTLYYFHQFPTYFIVANMTVVPCAGLLMAAAMAVLLAGGWPVLGAAARWLLQTLLGATDWVLGAVSALPHSTLHVSNFTPLAAVLTAGAVIMALAAAETISANCRECRE